MTNEQMIELEPEILKSCEEKVLRLDHLSRLVVKERWSTSDFGNGENYSTRTYQLKHAAVHSQKICLYGDAIDKDLIKRSMSDIALWMWSSFFRDELLKLIRHRLVVRDLSEIHLAGLTRIKSSNAKKINIFGKFVPKFIQHDSQFGLKLVLNPKYARSAEQVIFFHSDIAHFQFPDSERWIGELRWKNIPNLETNPDGKIGHYRLITTAAAKPVVPNLGTVVTVVPKGLRGLVYYWAWRLFRFVP